jgi:Tat protein secretion system quality control protein TatD with DNase activity
MIFCQSFNQPIIDMHMHADLDGFNIPNPNTGEILVQNAEEHRSMSLMYMEKNNVVIGAVSTNGKFEIVSQGMNIWKKEAGRKLLKGLFMGKKAGYPPIDSVRKWLTSGEIDFLGELAFQYDGRSPSDTAFYKYYLLAEELDIPVGIHTGTAAPRTPYNCCPNFRLSLGNPYLLEDMLVKFPKLRVWAMHAGGQFHNEMVTMMTMYPQLYVDISPYTWLESGNSEILDRFLKRAKEQSVLDRVMFGSDQMLWPEAIEVAINRVKSLDYLTSKEKADILYNNAAQFLQLDIKEIERHYGKKDTNKR